MMSSSEQDLRQRAAAVSGSYNEDSLLTCADEYVATCVPLTHRVKLASYVLQWYRAVPVKGIILGHAPSLLDKPNLFFPDTGSIPLSAAFSYNEDGLACKSNGLILPPLATHLLARDLGRACAVDEETALASLRNCWQLLDQGIISWYALPLGKQEMRYNNHADDAFRIKHNSRQIQTLAHALFHLLSISNQMDPSTLECTTIVAVGVWARQVTASIRSMLAQHSASISRRIEIKDKALPPSGCQSKGRGRNHSRECLLPLAPPEELRAIHALLHLPRNCSPSSLSPVGKTSPNLAGLVAGLRLDEHLLSCSTARADANKGRLRLRLEVPRVEDDQCREEGLDVSPSPFGGFSRSRYSVKEKGKAIMLEEPDSYVPSSSDSDDD